MSLSIQQPWARCLAVAAAVGLMLSSMSSAAPTSAKQARQVVIGWLKADAAPLGAQLAHEAGEATAYTDEDGRTAYYVVPLAPEGFVIVSADDWVEPIIAFSAVGTFNPSPAGPLGALVGRDLPARVQTARNLQIQSGTPPDSNAPAKWADLIERADAAMTTGLANVSDVWVSSFLASRWDQEKECSANCYNYYTPNNYVTGCVATALAQLLRHYQHPTAGIGVRSYTVHVDGVAQTAYTRGGNGAGGAYNWAQMPLDPDCTLTTTQRQAIGAIVHDCATTVSMSYTAAGSGADVFKAIDALKTVFGYSNGVKGYNSGGNIGAVLNTMINPNIDAGYPVILGISGDGGHAVIPDGYGYNSATLYHHVNMGWGGYYDMWYNLPTIDSYYNFNTVDVALYNMYVTGSGEIISGRVTDMGGNPLSGATVTATRTGGGVYTDTTDSRGIYALAKVPSGSSYAIGVSKSGYQFGTQNVATTTSQDWGTSCGNRWGINFAATNGQPPVSSAASVTTDYNLPLTVSLLATDDGVPNPPGAITYIIKTLPAHGALAVSGGSNIATVPYNLPAGVNQVVYTPATNYSGADSFGFAATDGGTAPNGGESNTATISITVTSCTVTAIGTGTFNWEYPMHTYYHDSRTQCIYLAGEVGPAGPITALALNVTTIPQMNLSGWTIRMKHTSQSTYAQAYLERTGWTIVYQGTELQGATGWRTFTFTTPFDYNGTSNLMIDFSHNNSDWAPSNGACAATTLGVYRSATARSDSERGDPLEWEGTTGAARNFSRPNVRLTKCAAAGPPSAPTGLTSTAITTGSITWAWTDTSGSEDGFRGRDAAQALKWTAAANATSYEETGLSPNTQYTRRVYAYNAQGESAGSNSVSVYTPAATPNVTCNRLSGCPAYAVATAFTFTNAAIFGTGGVAYYRYVWDRNTTYSFSGAETTWSSGTLQLTGSQVGAWYLHLAGYNDEHAIGAVVHAGPYLVATTVGYTPGDLDHDCDVDQADLDIFIACAEGPGVVQALPSCAESRLDGDTDVDASDFAILQRCWSGSGTPADPACGD